MLGGLQEIMNSLLNSIEILKTILNHKKLFLNIALQGREKYDEKPLLRNSWIYKTYGKIEGDHGTNISMFSSHCQTKKSLFFPIFKQSISCLHKGNSRFSEMLVGLIGN